MKLLKSSKERQRLKYCDDRAVLNSWGVFGSNHMPHECINRQPDIEHPSYGPSIANSTLNWITVLNQKLNAKITYQFTSEITTRTFTSL